MDRMSSELVLGTWRFGQTQAERMCAEILNVEGYLNVDPQSPLGGRDGGKDFLCTRDGIAWLGAAYFPTTDSTFPEVTTKFRSDLEGVAKNKRQGFVFLTNQRVTPGQRVELTRIADPIPVELYHLERIRSILDSPKGYGIRLEYLNIPMTVEEQVGLWSTLKDDITGRLVHQEIQILELHRKMDEVLLRTMAFGHHLVGSSSSLSTNPVPHLDQFPTADLHIGDILWIHRVLLDGTTDPRITRGRFRTVNVWIGVPGSTPETASFVPVSPERILDRLEALTAQWRSEYTSISKAENEVKITKLAEFHHGFLCIHPFLDGNGRVARSLLQQQALELTGRDISVSFTEVAGEYTAALDRANKGDLNPLSRLINANLE